MTNANPTDKGPGATSGAAPQQPAGTPAGKGRSQEHPGAAGVTTGVTQEHDGGDKQGKQGGKQGGKEKASQMKDAVLETGREEASQVGHEVASQTSKLLDEAGAQTKDRADEQVRGLAGHLGEISHDLDEMASNSPHPDSYVTALTRDGASAARNLSERLRSGGIDTLVDDVSGFARRRPGVFLAGAFAAGLGLGRLSRNADLRKLASSTNGGNGGGEGRAPRPSDDDTLARSRPTVPTASTSGAPIRQQAMP